MLLVNTQVDGCSEQKWESGFIKKFTMSEEPFDGFFVDFSVKKA